MSSEQKQVHRCGIVLLVIAGVNCAIITGLVIIPLVRTADLVNITVESNFGLFFLCMALANAFRVLIGIGVLRRNLWALKVALKYIYVMVLFDLLYMFPLLFTFAPTARPAADLVHALNMVGIGYLLTTLVYSIRIRHYLQRPEVAAQFHSRATDQDTV